MSVVDIRRKVCGKQFGTKAVVIDFKEIVIRLNFYRALFAAGCRQKK